MAEVAPNLTRYGLVEEANYFDQAAQLAAADKKAKDFATGKPLDVNVREYMITYVYAQIDIFYYYLVLNYLILRNLHFRLRS